MNVKELIDKLKTLDPSLPVAREGSYWNYEVEDAYYVETDISLVKDHKKSSNIKIRPQIVIF